MRALDRKRLRDLWNLRAQAIAARGNVLTQIGSKNLADPYLTCAWVRCQVYRGAGHEYASTTSAVRAGAARPAKSVRTRHKI